jgi:hypothetical protein
MGKELVNFISDLDDEILQWNGSVPKKNCEGFPVFFTFENFKKSPFGRHEAVVESSLASSSSLLPSSSS